MKIRISDLRESAVKRPAEYWLETTARRLSLDMSVSEHLGRGDDAHWVLTDFGPMDFVGRLDMWLDEVAQRP